MQKLLCITVLMITAYCMQAMDQAEKKDGNDQVNEALLPATSPAKNRSDGSYTEFLSDRVVTRNAQGEIFLSKVLIGDRVVIQNGQGEQIAFYTKGGHLLPTSRRFHPIREMAHLSWDINRPVNDIPKTPPLVSVQEAPSLNACTIAYVQSWINYLSSHQ